MELKLKNITKQYGEKKALDNFSLTFKPGIYGLLGPNGSGKSTMMKIITDNISPTKGEVFWDSTPILKMGDQYRSLLGYMPQQQGIYDNFTARRFLWYMCALKGIPKREIPKMVEQAAKKVNLYDVLDKKLGGFSGGMKQRVLIAQAILGDPKILIFDEPTAGLDPKERIRIRNLISEIAFDRIVIIATHVVPDIEFIAKKVVMLKSGVCYGCLPPSKWLKSVEGKVFEFPAREKDIPFIEKLFVVGNLRRDEKDTVWVRVVSDKKPKAPRLSLLPPTLEDVYLYMFNDRGEKK